MASGKINTEKFKKLLLAERERIQAQMGHDTPGEEEGQVDQLSELSHYDEHQADVATEMFEREKELAIEDNQKMLLEQIEGALHRIENGTYGQCDRCHKPIPSGRLEAIPYTILCVECAERLQGRL